MVSGTIYLMARYYNSDLGRFTQEDPIRDGRNWYSYCDSNPVNAIDPSGYAARSCFSDETDYLDSPDMKSMGIGGGGRVAPITSPYDSTSYSTYMARSNVAMYDASLGGYYSSGISSASANPGYYFLDYHPIVGDDQIINFDKKSIQETSKTNSTKTNSSQPNTSKGWHVGDPISKQTAAGNEPSKSTIRQRYWKNEADLYKDAPKGEKIKSESGTYYLTNINYDRIHRGLSPFDIDGNKVHLHHYRGVNNDLYAFAEITFNDQLWRF